MKRLYSIIFSIWTVLATFAQTFEIRECFESEIPSSVRGDYYKTVERYLDIYYQMLPSSIGNAENREAIINNVMANPDGKTLKTEFLLDDTKDLSFVSPMQYYVKFENVFSQMADDIEFIVDNISHGKIMMNSLVSCYIPVDYDLTLKNGEDILFKRRCRMTFLFQKIAISSIARTMQVEPLKDIIAYRPRLQDAGFKQQYDQAVQWYAEGAGQKNKYFPVFKSLAEKGYTDAQWHYSICLLNEDSTHHAEAVIWLQKAVDKNHPKAFNTLGWCYREGAGVSKNLQKAFEWFKRSAEADYHTGANNLAWAYEKGEGCQKSLAEAEKWYVKAGELGHPHAYGNCAYMYWSVDSKKAHEFILKGIENKNIQCYALLAVSYKFGYHDFPVDYDKAAENYKVVMDFRIQDNKKLYDDEWYEFYDKQYQEVKPWHDCKPENLFARLATDKSNPYIAKVNSYKAKKKDMDKYNKAIQKRHSNPDASLKELTKLAEAGMPKALAYIGGHWYKREQYTKAFQMYSAAGAKLDNCDALNGLGDCYYYGKHVPVNYTQAVRLYELAAIQDRTKTRFELGHSYYSSKGVNQSDDKAFRHFKDAAMAGSMDAAAYLGICYANGYGTKKDTIQAGQWMKKSAEKGIPTGLYGWGVYLYEGIGTQKNIPQAVEYFKKAAEGGIIPSMNCLGEHYYNLKQYSESLKWYEMAADKGNAKAQYWTAVLYSDKKDLANAKNVAKSWFTKSAVQGYVKAMSQLAWILHNEGTPEGKKQAFEWWNKAAQKGNVVSQYNLALCYDNAWGVTRSKANAVKWFIEAAKNKHKEAIAKVEELKKKYKPTRVPTPTKKGDYSGVVKVQGGIVYPDDRKNIFVYIPDTDIVTMTDDKGRFFLRGVKNVNDVHAIVARKGKSGQPGLNIKGTIL